MRRLTQDLKELPEKSIGTVCPCVRWHGLVVHEQPHLTAGCGLGLVGGDDELD